MPLGLGVPCLYPIQETAPDLLVRRAGNAPICFTIRLVGLVYIPPADPKGFHTKLSRFHNSFFNIGAVVFNELSGQGDWETGYRVGMKKKYDYYA